MIARNLADYLGASASRCPERLAVVDPTGTSITYAELNRRADALSRLLAMRGVERGDRVGIVLPKSTEAVIAIFAVLKAGAAYVPVDIAAPAERGRQILMDCGIRALIVHRRALAIAPAPKDADVVAVVVVDPDVAFSPNGREVAFEEAISTTGEPLRISADAADLAFLLYTSGSTGVPKGVMLTHGNAISFLEWCTAVFQPTEEDRFSSHAPFHFDPSILDLYLTVKHGASVYLVPHTVGKNPAALSRFIQDHRVTVWNSTPSILTLLVQFGDLSSHDGSSIRLVMFGGEVFPVKYLRELQRLWPKPVYYNLYGPTEATNTCTFARIPEVIPEDRQAPYPIGFPCSHCRSLVLDGAGREISPGEEGLLHISGPSVFAGYWGQPAQTSAAFLERDGVRWYNTGDVVRWDPADGFTYVGRKDRMVKRRGFRIELGDIEHALYGYSRVREAAVVSVSDNDADVKIVAFLVASDATPLSLIDLKAFCAARLPAYMSPDRFVFQDRLPRTSTDKVDYPALVNGLRTVSVE